MVNKNEKEKVKEKEAVQITRILYLIFISMGFLVGISQIS
jgi:hypothetical protein